MTWHTHGRPAMAVMGAMLAAKGEGLTGLIGPLLLYAMSFMAFYAACYEPPSDEEQMREFLEDTDFCAKGVS